MITRFFYWLFQQRGIEPILAWAMIGAVIFAAYEISRAF